MSFYVRRPSGQDVLTYMRLFASSPGRLISLGLISHTRDGPVYPLVVGFHRVLPIMTRSAYL